MKRPAEIAGIIAGIAVAAWWTFSGVFPFGWWPFG